MGSAGTTCPHTAFPAESGPHSKVNVIAAQSQDSFEEERASAVDLEDGLSRDRRSQGLGGGEELMLGIVRWCSHAL